MLQIDQEYAFKEFFVFYHNQKRKFSCIHQPAFYCLNIGNTERKKHYNKVMNQIRKAVHPKAHAAPRENAMYRAFGSTYSKGKYHIFFEHFPFGLYSSRRYIAHCDSEDLMLWRNEPIAIYPTKKEDEDGAYEGSVYAESETGDLELFYVGINYLSRDPKDLNTCTPDSKLKTNLMSIKSVPGSLGNSFDNINLKKVILPDEDLKKYGLESGTALDPEVLLHNSTRYLTFLAKGLDKKNYLCFLKEQKNKWLFIGKQELHDQKSYRTLRLFQCNKKWICACETSVPSKDKSVVENECFLAFVTMDFNKATLEIAPKHFILDYGYDLRAPKIAYDTRNIPYVMASYVMSHDIKGERGMVSCPRRVLVEENFISFQIHPLISKRFIYKSKEAKIRQTHFPLVIKASFKDEAYLKLGSLSIYRTGSTLNVDRRKCMDNESNHHRLGLATIPVTKSNTEVTILLDQDVIEIECENQMISFIYLSDDSSIHYEGLTSFAIYTSNATKS